MCVVAIYCRVAGVTALMFVPSTNKHAYQRKHLDVWLTAAQLSEQLTCHSHKEKTPQASFQKLQSPDRPPKKGTTQTGHGAGQGNASLPH